MKVYVVLYDADYDNDDYIGVYSSEEKVEKGIEEDIVRRHGFASMSLGLNYYKSFYYIIEEELD